MYLLVRNFDMKGLSAARFTKIDGFRRDFDKAKMEIRFKLPGETSEKYKEASEVMRVKIQSHDF